MNDKKIFNDTKCRFQIAYRYSGMNLQNYNDMLYYMNILAILKSYPEDITAGQLDAMIENGTY